MPRLKCYLQICGSEIVTFEQVIVFVVSVAHFDGIEDDEDPLDELQIFE